MEFRILGPLEVRSERGAVRLEGLKPRAVLAVLLLHANEPVSAERLALALWGEDAPAARSRRCRCTSRGCARRSAIPGCSSPRRPATGCGCVPASSTPSASSVASRPGGDALAAGRAERAAGAVARGARAVARAAAGGVGVRAVRAGGDRAAGGAAAGGAGGARGGRSRRRARTRRWSASSSGSGRAPDARAAARPQLMLALYRSGRQAEALEVYRDARGVLVERAGVEPGPELHDLQQAMLVHDPRSRRARRDARVRTSRRHCRRCRIGRSVAAREVGAVAQAAAVGVGARC